MMAEEESISRDNNWKIYYNYLIKSTK